MEGTGSTGSIDCALLEIPRDVAPDPARKRGVTQLVISLIGISEGLTHLAALATYYLFKDDLGLSPAQVSSIFIAPAFPWFLKPLFAFCSDTYPVFGMRRKPYLILFSILQSIGFLCLAVAVKGILGAVLALFLVAFSGSFCAAIAEALVVEQGSGPSAMTPAESVTEFISAKAIGSLLVAYLSGYLLERVSKATVFTATAFFPLIVTVSALCMTDTSMGDGRSIAEQFHALRVFLTQPVIWGPMLYILAYMAGPDYDDAMFFYFTNYLGFTPTFMGTLRFTYGIAAIVGILLYRLYKNTPYRKLLTWSILIAIPAYLSPIILVTRTNLKLHISDEFFVLSGGFLTEAVAEIQLLPLLVLAASVSPAGLEGSIYGVIMAVRNLGGAVSRALSSVSIAALGITATDFTNLALYIWICGAFSLIPLLFLDLIPEERDVTKQKEEWEMIQSTLIPYEQHVRGIEDKIAPRSSTDSVAGTIQSIAITQYGAIA